MSGERVNLEGTRTMKPTEFLEQNCVYAKDQPEYLPLPVHRTEDGMVISCWALTWRGRFLDALTTWEERAMTPARPLGEEVTVLPPWTAFVRVGTSLAADAPASESVRYRGYALGADGVPTFRYDLGPLRVEDTLRPGEAGGYRRTLVVRGGGPGWLFRGAAPGAEPQPVSFDAAGEARLEEALP
jgi:hypothetical protein